MADSRRDFGAEAAEHWRLVDDDSAVRFRYRRHHRFHIERGEAAQVDDLEEISSFAAASAA